MVGARGYEGCWECVRGDGSDGMGEGVRVMGGCEG